MTSYYRLWSKDRGDWCDYDIVGEKSYGDTIRGLLPVNWDIGGTELRRDFELVPEPNNSYDKWAIAVRADNRSVGYIPRIDAPAWAGVVRRVVASGYIPVVPGRVYAFMANDWETWDGDGDPPQDFAAKVQLKLGDPATALPINDPPAVPYTLIPRSGVVQVTKEELHTDALLRLVPPTGYGLAFVTLHEQDTSNGNTPRSVVEVRIDNECVGQLTRQMSQRFLPMIRHHRGRGLVTTCWGDITGSAVAAEVRIDAVKANEADAAVLDGDPVTVPRLVAAISDPSGYELPGTAGGQQDQARFMVSTGIRSAGSAAPRPPLPPAGWYSDPGNPRVLRYWDGSAWTHHTALKPGYAR